MEDLQLALTLLRKVTEIPLPGLKRKYADLFTQIENLLYKYHCVVNGCTEFGLTNNLCAAHQDYIAVMLNLE